jgi:hypothetical protein
MGLIGFDATLADGTSCTAGTRMAVAVALGKACVVVLLNKRRSQDLLHRNAAQASDHAGGMDRLANHRPAPGSCRQHRVRRRGSSHARHVSACRLRAVRCLRRLVRERVAAAPIAMELGRAPG